MTAEKTCVIFDANLGAAPVANRDRLAAAFSETVRASAIACSAKGGGEPEATAAAEAIRVVDDALSCATDMSFLGQATKAYSNNRDLSDPRAGSFHTMPIKLEFPDRSSRIYFERVMREKCNIRASMSLPPGIRKAAETCRRNLLPSYPDEMVMVRAESDGQKFVAFHKRDGEPKWTRHPETFAIPISAVLSDSTQERSAAEKMDQ